MAVPQRPHTRGPTCGLLAAIVAQANHRAQLQQQGQQLFDAREQIATQEHEHEQALARAKAAARSKRPSWRRHVWRPRAPLAASEGSGRSSALVRKRQAPPIPQRGRGLAAGRTKLTEVRCV